MPADIMSAGYIYIIEGPFCKKGPPENPEEHSTRSRGMLNFTRGELKI